MFSKIKQDQGLINTKLQWSFFTIYIMRSSQRWRTFKWITNFF